MSAIKLKIEYADSERVNFTQIPFQAPQAYTSLDKKVFQLPPVGIE